MLDAMYVLWLSFIPFKFSLSQGIIAKRIKEGIKFNHNNFLYALIQQYCSRICLNRYLLLSMHYMYVVHPQFFICWLIILLIAWPSNLSSNVHVFLARCSSTKCLFSGSTASLKHYCFSGLITCMLSANHTNICRRSPKLYFVGSC